MIRVMKVKMILPLRKGNALELDPNEFISDDEAARFVDAVFEEFTQAVRNGDERRLLALLADEVRFVSDGGGRARARARGRLARTQPAACARRRGPSSPRRTR